MSSNVKLLETGKCINQRARNGLEIPVQYNVFGLEKAVDWVEKCVNKVTDIVENRTKNCAKYNYNEYSFHKNYFLIVSCLRFTKCFFEKTFIWYTGKVSTF